MVESSKSRYDMIFTLVDYPPNLPAVSALGELDATICDLEFVCFDLFFFRK